MKPMRMVLLLGLFFASAARAEENEGRPASDPKKISVADVLQALRLDESKLLHSDEPPGKLRQVEAEVPLRDTRIKVRVRIELVYTTALFSIERKWDPKAVRAAGVRQVVITPLDAAP